MHLQPQLCTESPGPALYDLPSALGETAAYRFPGASTGRTASLLPTVGPAPDAYSPLLVGAVAVAEVGL